MLRHIITPRYAIITMMRLAIDITLTAILRYYAADATYASDYVAIIADISLILLMALLLLLLAEACCY